ncbi:hypothetical protein AAMO2058_000211400 [Amorphochlora amoebiformis]
MRNLDPSYDLRVVHFDHGLRGEDSSLDRQLVVDTCERLRGDFEVYVREWEEGNSKHPKGLQDAARRWRSQELEQIVSNEMKAYNVAVAVGHQADDSVETVFLKLLRGSHLANLQGISGVVKEGEVVKLRPLLEFAKCELIDYLREVGMEWREDKSNESGVYRRNRVRAELIPILQSLAGSPKALTDRINELSAQASLLESWIDEYLESKPQNHSHCNHTKVFTPDLSEPKLIQRERLARFLTRRKGGDAVFARSVQAIFEMLEKNEGGGTKTVDIGGGYQALCQGGEVRVVEPESRES